MKNILVVEDELDIQELLCAFLEDAGYRVTVAGDGVEGIACFHGSVSLNSLENFFPIREKS